MSEQSPLLPALKANDWVGREHSLCRPLVPDLDTPYMPWVAFGYDHPHTFEFVTNQSMPGGSDPAQLQLLEHAAVRNLRTRNAAWQTEKIKAAGKKLSLLICGDDFLAAERILDREFMAEAQARLKTKLLAVSAPYRGLLLAFDAQQPRERVEVFAAIAATQFFQTDSAPISPLTFLMDNGQIVGMIQGAEEQGQAVAEANQSEEPEIYQQVIVVSDPETGKESLHILIGGADLDQFARVLSNVFTHGLQEMHKRGQFGGDVMIVIIPDLTPRSHELDELLPRVQAHLQGVGRELHERGAFTSPVSVTFHYGMPGENPPLAGPPSASSGIRRIKPAAQPAEPAIAVETLDTTELINALSSDDAGVREAASARLAEQGRQDQQVVRRLIVALGSNSSQVSLGAVQALALIGEPVVPLLRLAMEKGDERMREFTVAALSEIAPRTLLPDLIAWMRDPVAGVRYRATQAIAKLREPTTSDALLQALPDPDQRVRELAVSGLGQLRDPRAVEPLIDRLKDSAVSVRVCAVETLNQFHDDQALPALVAAVCDPEEQVTRVAITGVMSFGSQAVPYVTAARDMLDKQADPRGYQLLTQILNDCGAGGSAKRGGNFLDKAGAFWRRK